MRCLTWEQDELLNVRDGLTAPGSSVDLLLRGKTVARIMDDGYGK